MTLVWLELGAVAAIVLAAEVGCEFSEITCC